MRVSLSWFDRVGKNTFKTEPGSHYVDQYGAVFDKDTGHKDIKKKGQPINIYEMIQSHAESVNIHVILDRFKKTGDLSLFSQVTGQFLDLTNMPSNIPELFQRVNDASSWFDHQDPAFKSQFHNSVSEFLTAVENGKVDISMKKDIIQPDSDVKVVPEKEVKANES